MTVNIKNLWKKADLCLILIRVPSFPIWCLRQDVISDSTEYVLMLAFCLSWFALRVVISIRLQFFSNNR